LPAPSRTNSRSRLRCSSCTTIPLARKYADEVKRLRGHEQADYATSLNNLATLLQLKHDYAGAEPLYRQALDIERKALGDDHPGYAHTLNNLTSGAKSRYAIGPAPVVRRHDRAGDPHVAILQLLTCAT
jgi:hypothetical protein